MEALLIRRLLGLAPQPPSEALITILTGVGAAVLAIVTPRADWAPAWSGAVIASLGLLAIARGIVGLSGVLPMLRGVIQPNGWPGNRAPRTQAEIADLLAAPRRTGWEFYLVTGYLVVGRERVEPLYLDHQLRFRRGVTERVDDNEVIAYIQRALVDARRIIANITDTVRPEVTERAFGAPGESGDAARIEHFADRLTTAYSDMLEWAARLRSAIVDETYRRVVDLQTGLVDRSIQNYRLFVDQYVAEVDGPMTEAIRTHGSWTGNFTIQLDIDDDVLEAINAEIAVLSGE
jgi:hypothetical protein